MERSREGETSGEENVRTMGGHRENQSERNECHQGGLRPASGSIRRVVCVSAGVRGLVTRDVPLSLASTELEQATNKDADNSDGTACDCHALIGLCNARRFGIRERVSHNASLLAS